jgi:biopolymer transport protein ExbB
MRTILVWFQSGGPFIAPLVFVGLVGLLLLLERTVYIVIRSKIHARPFIEKVISLTRAAKFDEALQLCADHQSALPDLGLVILRSRDSDENDLTSVAKTATMTMIPELTRRLSWLPSLALIAGLVGLLGGIANLHDEIARGSAMPASLAYALRPLGVGVLIAIPIIAWQAYLVSEARKVGAQLEEFAVRLINALVDRPDIRLGHRD